MYKRLSIRLVPDLSTSLSEISKKRGLSVNALVTEITWDFVEDWKKKHDAAANKKKHKAS